MTPWAIVAGDFVPTGGMDMANLALARYLARTDEVHVVAHRADPQLAAMPNVRVHRVPRPAGLHSVGEMLLSRAGRRVAKRIRAVGGRAVANGGNCLVRDINWAHYVHRAYRPASVGSPVRRLKNFYASMQARKDEFAAFRQSELAICNSRLTAQHLVQLLGVPPSRVRTVYYGTDPLRFPPISHDERTDARRDLGWDDRPWALHVGSLGDRRKGFDTLYAAWRTLCSRTSWDVNLAVVGRGAELPTWQARTAADGLAKRIAFLGFRTEVPKVLAAVNVLVHPSRYEAYGLGVHEALCRGLPAVVSASAGVAERYPADLKELLLADAENADELVQRLCDWRRNLESYRARMCPLADELRSRTWDDMAAEIKALVLAT